MMTNRGLLLEQAQKRVNDSGYTCKKENPDQNCQTLMMKHPLPKEGKITQDYRLERMSELQDKIKDLN